MNKLMVILRESSTARFLIPTGLILLIFGIVILVVSIDNQNYIEIEATVSKVELVQDTYVDSDGTTVQATYDVTVKYTVDGKEYEGVLSGLSKYNVGDKMKIYYDPSNPNNITQTKSIILPVAIIIGGFSALIGGIISAINAIKRHKKMKEQERSWANDQ